MKRFSLHPEGQQPVACDTADQAVQHFANALHHGLSGTWKVCLHLPRFSEFPDKRRGKDELYVSLCRKFALRKRRAERPSEWSVLCLVEGEWRELVRGESRKECEVAMGKWIEARSAAENPTTPARS